jgi:hypothetical protein
VSLYDYEQSRQLASQDEPFYALIMAAMRRADTHNQRLLQAGWPGVWQEMQERYNAPGGRLESDSVSATVVSDL